MSNRSKLKSHNTCLLQAACRNKKRIADVSILPPKVPYMLASRLRAPAVPASVAFKFKATAEDIDASLRVFIPDVQLEAARPSCGGSAALWVATDASQRASTESLSVCSQGCVILYPEVSQSSHSKAVAVTGSCKTPVTGVLVDPGTVSEFDELLAFLGYPRRTRTYVAMLLCFCCDY